MSDLEPGPIDPDREEPLPGLHIPAQRLSSGAARARLIDQASMVLLRAEAIATVNPEAARELTSVWRGMCTLLRQWDTTDQEGD